MEHQYLFGKMDRFHRMRRNMSHLRFSVFPILCHILCNFTNFDVYVSRIFNYVSRSADTEQFGKYKEYDTLKVQQNSIRVPKIEITHVNSQRQGNLSKLSSHDHHSHKKSTHPGKFIKVRRIPVRNSENSGKENSSVRKKTEGSGNESFRVLTSFYWKDSVIISNFGGKGASTVRNKTKVQSRKTSTPSPFLGPRGSELRQQGPKSIEKRGRIPPTTTYLQEETNMNINYVNLMYLCIAD